MSDQEQDKVLPPRKNPTPTKICRQHLTPLQTLLQMGFSNSRAQKALVATGHRGVQIASDWLLAHVNDPKIDDARPRKFVVYLCPTGALQDQLQTFWDASKVQIGWNGAHNSFPHLTLTSSFSCPHENVEKALRVVEKACHDFFQDFSSEPFRLEKYQSPNFFGLFVSKKDEILLRSFTQELKQQLAALLQVAVEVNCKSFQVSLAYQFHSQHYPGLEDLAAVIDPRSDADWEVRVYSYDENFQESEVFRVLYAHVPREEDELELMIGDFVYIKPDELVASSDGWILGTSWLTGSQGYIPKNYIKKTAETNAWTLHLAIPMTRRKSRDELTNSSSISTSTSSLERLKDLYQTPVSYAPREKQLDTNIVETDEGTSPRQVMICRHGERVDFTFGTWIPFCFDEAGVYTQRDLNMPKSLPKRKAGPEGFLRDSPLTRFGIFQAKTVGSSLKESNVKISHAFCSPALRCVQTCHNILAGMGLEKVIKINLEPGLFEWMAWYQNAMPDWMSPDEFVEAGFNVQCSYKPYISADELQDSQETTEQFYTRNFFVTQCILQSTEDQMGNILLVGHAASLDVCTRQITGLAARNSNEMLAVVRKIPYLSMAVIEETIADQKSSWTLKPPPIPPLTHSNNSRYDWKILSEENPGRTKSS